MKNSSLRSSRLGIQILLLLGACSSHKSSDQAANNNADKSGDNIQLAGGIDNPEVAAKVLSGRAPASTSATGIPYAPGPARHGTATQSLQPPSPTNPTAPNPTAPSTGATTRCNLRLDQIAINPKYTYSIVDVLFRRATAQDVTYKHAQFGSFTGSFDLDRQALQPWFGGSLGGPGSDLFAAAKTSQAYYRAMSFVNGATAPATDASGRPQYFTADDYLQNDKMASILAAMFQTESDPECTRYIRNAANTILRSDLIPELDEVVALIQAAQAAQANPKQFQADFKELDSNRTTLQKQQETLDNDIEHKKEAAERETNQIQSDLKKLYQQLKLKFVSLPGCARLVSYHEQFDAGQSTEKDFMQKLTTDCRDQVNKSLDAKNTEQLDLTAKAAKLSEELSKNPDNSATIQQIADLNAKLKTLQGKISDLQTSLDWVNGVGEDSIVKQMDAMGKLLNRRDEINNASYYADDRQKIAELQQRIDTTSSKWLTYGYSGGFDFLPSWQQRYRRLGAAPLSAAGR